MIFSGTHHIFVEQLFIFYFGKISIWSKLLWVGEKKYGGIEIRS